MEFAAALATDASGNLFAEITDGTSDQGITMFDPSRTATSFAPKTSAVASWSALKVGPGGDLYAARATRAIFKYDAAGGAAAALWQAFPTGTFITVMDFDQSQNLWAGGNNSSVYRVKQDKSIATFPFVANVRAVRVFNGYLYMAALKDGAEKIWRAPIIGDSLGTPEVYFDFDAVYGSKSYVPQVLTFASDGTMYVGTDAPEGIVIVSPGGAAMAPLQAYKDLFATSVKYLAWGPGDILYASSNSGVLMFVRTRKTGAPIYGP